jgi:hypothetical protein
LRANNAVTALFVQLGRAGAKVPIHIHQQESDSKEISNRRIDAADLMVDPTHVGCGHGKMRRFGTLFLQNASNGGVEDALILFTGKATDRPDLFVARTPGVEETFVGQMDKVFAPFEPIPRDLLDVFLGWKGAN